MIIGAGHCGKIIDRPQKKISFNFRDHLTMASKKNTTRSETCFEIKKAALHVALHLHVVVTAVLPDLYILCSFRSKLHS